MKTRFLLFIFFTICGIVSAQDTIFVKSGEIIPAVIIEKNSTEIKYRKFGQAQQAAIYSVFVSDIASIHYRNGLVADYTQAGQSLQTTPKRPVDFANTMKVIRLAVGFEGDYFRPAMNSQLYDFWQHFPGNQNPALNVNPISIPIIFKMGFVLGNSGRNWLGDELQLILQPDDAINGTANDKTREVKLRNFYYNIILFYGHTINHKRNVALMLEPGLDVAFTAGHFILPDFSNGGQSTYYTESGTGGIGYHIATGVEWVIARRLTFSGRVGYRYSKLKEDHKGPDGYEYFYSYPFSNQQRMVIEINGPYASVGLCYNFYLKMRGMKLE